MTQKKFFVHVLTTAAILIFLLGGAAPGADSMRATMQDIMDPQSNMPAARVMVPAGWKSEGQVLWDCQNLYFPARVILAVVNEAEDLGFLYYPMAVYTYTSDPQLNTVKLAVQVKSPVSAVEYITEVLGILNSAIADFRIVNTQKSPELAELFEKEIVPAMLQRQQSIVSRMNPGTRGEGVTYDVARVKFAYTDKGKQYEGYAQAGIAYSTLGWPSSFSGYTRSVEWWADSVVITAAQAGKYDFHKPEFATIMLNTRIDPVWNNLVMQYGNQLRMQKAEQIRIEGEMIRRNFQQNLQSMNRREVMSNASESQSKIMRGWTDAITGTDRWTNGDETYSAPTDYNYGWSGPNGQTYYTNDSMFNPNHSSNFSGDWSQMQKTPW